MTQPPQSSDPGQQAGQTPQQKQVWPIVLASVLGSIIVIVTIIAFAGVPGEPAPTVTVTEYVPSDEAVPTEEGLPEDPTEEPGSAPAYTPNRSDWTLKIKITEKTCYGAGVGCNVTAKVTPDYNASGALPDEGAIDITYKITGDENGPQTGTVTVYLADKKSDVGEHYLATPSSGTKIKATVTDVEYNEFG